MGGVEVGRTGVEVAVKVAVAVGVDVSDGVAVRVGVLVAVGVAVAVAGGGGVPDDAWVLVAAEAISREAVLTMPIAAQARTRV